MAREEVLRPGVTGLMDEIFGEPYHSESNEKMVYETGLLRYFSMLDIPYYTILRSAFIDDTARRFDKLYRSLITVFPKSLALMNMQSDGTIAGISPNRQDFTNPLFDQEKRFEMISWFEDEHGVYKKRVTMTFLGLSMIDFFIVFAMGESSKPALAKMLEKGSEEDFPARFFLRPEIAQKTLLITDQTL
jgi:6-phosphogluconolactonase/glucosamine-6-phosphate isomerase/deaminase